MGVGGVRAKLFGAVAAALCSRHARRVWRRGAAGHVFGPWCACGAVQACSLACYVLHDVHGSGLSRNFGFIRLYAVSIGLCKIRRQNRVYWVLAHRGARGGMGISGGRAPHGMRGWGSSKPGCWVQDAVQPVSANVMVKPRGLVRVTNCNTRCPLFSVLASPPTA